MRPKIPTIRLEQTALLGWGFLFLRNDARGAFRGPVNPHENIRELRELLAQFRESRLVLGRRRFPHSR